MFKNFQENRAVYEICANIWYRQWPQILT